MNRDHRELTVFRLADELVVEIYETTNAFPAAERFGLRSQIRRASVSVPTNIVEGCARRTLKEYVRFLNLALASASEVRYLVDLCKRLEYVELEDSSHLTSKYSELIRGLHTMISTLQQTFERS